MAHRRRQVRHDRRGRSVAEFRDLDLAVAGEHEDAARPGVGGELHVAHVVADHPRRGQVGTEFRTCAVQRRRMRLATLASVVGRMRTHVGGVDPEPRRGEVVEQAAVIAGVVVEREDAPADAALVGHDRQPEARGLEPAERVDRSGQHLVVLEPVPVVDVGDERPVAIEEDIGSLAHAPTIARIGMRHNLAAPQRAR